MARRSTNKQGSERDVVLSPDVHGDSTYVPMGDTMGRASGAREGIGSGADAAGQDIEVQRETIVRADSPLTNEPNEDAIRLRAYERFVARGEGAGDALTDWLEAERELRGEPRP